LVEKAVREEVLRPSILAQGRLDAAALVSLEKAYGLKMKTGGLNHPPVALSKAGASAIWLSSAMVERRTDFDGDGNDISRQDGAVFTRGDGSVGAYADIWFSHK
jgi:hypothetical protein